MIVFIHNYRCNCNGVVIKWEHKRSSDKSRKDAILESYGCGITRTRAIIRQNRNNSYVSMIVWLSLVNDCILQELKSLCKVTIIICNKNHTKIFSHLLMITFRLKCILMIICLSVLPLRHMKHDKDVFYLWLFC